MRKPFTLNLKKKFYIGLSILILIGVAKWIFDSFLAGVDSILRVTVYYFVPSLRDQEGTGLLAMPIIAILLGSFASVKPIQWAAKWIILRIPFIGKFIEATLGIVTDLKSLPLVEVAYPTEAHLVKGWLRSVRWAERPLANGETEQFIECTVALPTMNNPTTGWGVITGPTAIHYVLSNSSMDFLLHVFTFTLFNPRWKRQKIFDPYEYLEKELLPETAHTHISQK